MVAFWKSLLAGRLAFVSTEPKQIIQNIWETPGLPRELPFRYTTYYSLTVHASVNMKNLVCVTPLFNPSKPPSLTRPHQQPNVPDWTQQHSPPAKHHNNHNNNLLAALAFELVVRRRRRVNETYTYNIPERGAVCSTAGSSLPTYLQCRVSCGRYDIAISWHFTPKPHLQGQITLQTCPCGPPWNGQGQEM